MNLLTMWLGHFNAVDGEMRKERSLFRASSVPGRLLILSRLLRASPLLSGQAVAQAASKPRGKGVDVKLVAARRLQASKESRRRRSALAPAAARLATHVKTISPRFSHSSLRLA